tara:strand:- start:79438 stop:80211 length:774 start_codon:yes stop_codon:yes gene_type:complete
MSKKKTLIGILAHNHLGKYQPGYGQNAAYIHFARSFNADVIMIDANNTTTIPVDLLILPGGRDVNPLRYGQKPHYMTDSPDMEYESFYDKNIGGINGYVERAKEGKTAIYGICAGFQNLNVHFNGSIIQHVHNKKSSEWRGDLVDELETVVDNFPKDYIGETRIYARKDRLNYKDNIPYTFKTNSIHHQAINDENLSNEFLPLAYDKKHRNIEFMIHKNLPIAAEQSHPEERNDPFVAIGLINTLLNRIEKNAEKEN